MQATRGPESPAVQSPAVQVYVLGGFKVVVRGEVLPEHVWRRKTARQLFKILLSRPNRRMTRDEVIELLWPESDPEAASSNLRSTLFALRHALEPSTAPAGVAVVFSDRAGVWLRPNVELWVDADAFEHTVEEAWRSADPLPLLEEASSFYAGHYLPEDLYEDWATERREALKQRWAELQLRLSHELEHRGDPESAVRPLQRLLQVDPCDERAAQEAMQLLNRHGRRAEALRIYQRLVEALKEELDVEPSEATTELQRQISAGDTASA
ncbi:MAG TPA: BTAD domain-containing putative transcriptional regulator, partial [Ktedonobacterales bacterium]|nr:BTAD domain-containing putative transcriptional regulator [Ktedonobacterales bacterium]